ncbi:MAG: hypothetical protein WCO06_00465 [Candidatus Roizmanbacteria bacterium]
MLTTVSFVAFIITVALLVYELILYIRANRSSSVPNIPEFDQELNGGDSLNATPIQVVEKKPLVNPQLILIGILIVMALLFGAGALWSSRSKAESINEEKQSNIVKLEGIEVYSSEGVLLKPEEELKLKSGDVIIIGIKTLADASIDKARIRINESVWNVSHETSHFDKEKSIFFVEYDIPVDSKKIEIEAQLHSKKDGWLGE